MPIQIVDSLVKWFSLLYRIHSVYRAFFSCDESKYSLGDHSDSHSGSLEISINAIDLISDGISTSVPTDIYISTNYDLVYSLDPVDLLESIVTENPVPSFDRDNPLDEDFKIRHITSKSSDNTNASTNEEFHNSDTIRSQLDTGARVSLSDLKYIIHHYRPYISEFRLPIQLISVLDTSKSTLP